MEKVRLGDVCDVRDGTHDSPKYNDSGYPLVTSKNLSKGFVDFTDCNLISKEDYDKINIRSKVDVGDILMPMIGTVGNPVIVQIEPEFAIKNVALIKFYKDSKVLNKYIKVLLASNYFYRTVVSKIRGGTQKFISLNDIRGLEIILPPISEQLEIVDRIEKVNVLIEKCKQQISKLDELVKARFVEQFGDCKNEVLIGDVISISRGASPRPISAFITDREDGVNWIKIGDVSENSLYITKTEEKITPEGAKKSRMVHKGDFILSNSMSFGRPYILGINGCVHDGWLIMSDFKETFNELYLYHAIRSDDVQYQFSGKVNGATVKNLNSDLVKNTFIKVPSMELQNQFAAFVEQTDKSKLEVQKSLEKLELLKKALMQKYFG